MNMRQLSLGLAVAGAYACVFALPAFAQDEELPGASDLSGLLVQYGAYVLQPEARASIDAINRDIRDAQNQIWKATTPESKQDTTAKRSDAVRRLDQLLGRCGGIIDVTVSGEKAVLPVKGPIALSAETTAMLFRITTGDGPVRCAAVEYDFSEQSGRITVPVIPNCVTWALVALKNVPGLTTEVSAEFVMPDKAPTVLPLKLTTPDKGMLHLTVLSADDGQLAPFMIRLVSKTDGREVKPGGAIEFSPQFDKQGNNAGARRANFPGKLAGRYWCVPGPFSTALTPGEWDVVIERGVEHAPVFDTISISSGQTTEKTYAPKRWVDMRKTGWYSGDDHVHCQLLSDADATNLMAWIRAEDVHLANVVKMGDIYRTWFEQRGFGKDFRVIEDDYILSPGQECPRTHSELGHTLQMNITKMIRDTDQYYLYDRVFDEVHAQGGLSGYAHVNSGIFQVHRDMTMNIAKNKIDFVELLQFANLGTDLYYDFLNTGFKVTASAGSDVPWGGSVGEVRVYAHVGKKKFTADRWFDAVRKGHTFVTNGVMIEFSVDKALPGEEIAVSSERPLHVHAKAWGHRDRLTPTKLDIIVHGDVIKSAVSENPDEDTLRLDFDLPPGNGFWIAARAEGSDGSRAHTTPVYVVRKPLRFWKYDAAPELIAKRLDSLKEIEQIVADASDKNAKGEVEDNRPIKQLALQGPDLLKRVADAKAIYEGLQQTVEKEKTLRNANSR